MDKAQNIHWKPGYRKIGYEKLGGRKTCFQTAGFLIAFFLFALHGSAQADTAIERGQKIASTCVACHQADGMGLDNPGGESWPRLAGLDADYIAAQLKAFKSGDRENISMKTFAQMLNDEQISDVAAYYASLPAGKIAPPEEEPDPDLLKHGKELALNGDWNRYIVPCMSCHGPGNQGVGSAFPGIAGQQPGYIVGQLRAWQEGTRKGDPLDLMGTIARRMDDRDMEAVSLWLGSQQAAETPQEVDQ